MFRTDVAMKNYISGVILYDETIRQKAKDGTTLVKLIQDAGAVPGHQGRHRPDRHAGLSRRSLTQGLDGLRERFVEYHKLGARFRQMARVIDIDGIRPPASIAKRPGDSALRRLAQENGIVPIIEPEVLMDGAHDAARNEEVTTSCTRSSSSSSSSPASNWKASSLKPNMIVAGQKCANQPSVQEVAERTLRVLRHHPVRRPRHRLPVGRPVGPEFDGPSGCDEQAGRHPWPLTSPATRPAAAPQKAWGGKPENVEAGKAKRLSSRADELQRRARQVEQVGRQGCLALSSFRPSLA